MLYAKQSVFWLPIVLVAGLLSVLIGMQFALWKLEKIYGNIADYQFQVAALESARFHEDRIDDILRLYAQSVPAQRPELLAEYREHDESITASLARLGPLPSYSVGDRAVLQDLKQDYSQEDSYNDRTLESSGVFHRSSLFSAFQAPVALMLEDKFSHDSTELIGMLDGILAAEQARAQFTQRIIEVMLPLVIAGGIVALLTDIQARKGLTRENYRLSRRVEELEEARREVEQASFRKSSFIANVSHELRTPLSAIIGNAELLLEQPLGVEQKALAETVQHSADSLLNIVNDILDLTKLEAGKLELHLAASDPTAIVHECIQLMSVNAAAKDLYCRCHMEDQIPRVVLTDPDRLRQILLNLIGNAIKFTQKGGVTVDVGVLDRSVDQVALQFSVIDTGIGISPSDIERLFKPFTQLDGGLRTSGTGLGLSISRQLAILMDGDIGVHSQLGEGSTFSLVVRCRVPEEIVHADNVEVEPAARGAKLPRDEYSGKVLIVEDNPVLQALTLKQLEALGVQAEAVSDGAKALELTRSQPFDLILMDVHLPGMNGYDVTVAIRNQEEGSAKHVPIVAMTAAAMASDRERCFRAGMDDYLSKPAKMKDIARVIHHWVHDGNGNSPA